MGLVDDDGNLSYKEIVKIDDSNRNEEFIFSTIKDYVDKHSAEVEYVGIGVPGIVHNNEIVYTCNLPLKNVKVALL